MKNKLLKKEYIAICEGIFNNNEKIRTINAPIARKENSIIERCVNPNGDKSITHYEVIKENDKYSLLKINLETGRTHQIRVHLSYINHPIIGDTLYGHSSDIITRQALHAYKVSFVHPITKKYVSFIAELPLDMKKITEKF